jgi:hypothetical protein
VFGLSASQLVFSSIPESYAFSALGLVLLFAVIATPDAGRLARLGAGVVAFGVTATNLVAVALASVCSPAERRLGRRLLVGMLQVGAVVLLTAVLSHVQRALYPTTQVFFIPQPLPDSYANALAWPEGARDGLLRLGSVVSHVGFASIAAPRPTLRPNSAGSVTMDLDRVGWLRPSLASGIHWLLWAILLVHAGRSRLRSGPSPVEWTLILWLAFVAALHVIFGSSLFLYSGHWVFAVVALVAAGLERRPLGTPRVTIALLLSLLAAQVAANAALVRQMLRVFAAV